MKQPMTNKELRIKVAEARGWTQKTYVERDAGGAIHRHPGCWYNENEYGDIPLNLPKYTTSMDACIELIEEIVSIKRLRLEMSSGKKGWYVFIYKEESPREGLELLVDEYAEALPEAICNAYLAFKEGRK